MLKNKCSLSVFLIYVSENKVSSINCISNLIHKSKEKTQKLAIEHRELHSTVSKVGKAIDRV
jgi:hypothetical protein